MNEFAEDRGKRRTVDPFAPLPYDLNLLKNSPVTLYHSQEILQTDLQKLVGCGYQCPTFDCALWDSEMTMHREFARQLSFPDYYGHNLDALNDCLGDNDVVTGDLAIVLTGFDVFFAKFPRAWHVLDIIAAASWWHLLFGRRLLGLVQTNDPKIVFEPIGARTVTWNPIEWFQTKPWR